MLQFLEEDPSAKGVFIYPTKVVSCAVYSIVVLYLLQALAQDQKAAFEKLVWACPGLEHIQVLQSHIYPDRELNSFGSYQHMMVILVKMPEQVCLQI